MTNQQLTAAQLEANRKSIHAYLDALSLQYGMGRVFLIPRFEEQADGTWSPVDGNGVRPTKESAAFCRLGKKTRNLENGKAQYIFTNMFMDDEAAVLDLLMEHGAVYGTPITTARLVIHEQLTPFSRKNPDNDIKYADRQAGLVCMKNVSIDPESGEMVPTGTAGSVIKAANIYRRVKAFFAVEGEYSANAINKLIVHDNSAAISDAAYAKFNALRSNTTVSAAGKKQSIEQAIKEIKAIKVKDRTDEQKTKLAELEEQLEEMSA